MRLRDILFELNSRSKKTAPNIFNEPINCGFEAEFFFMKKAKIDDMIDKIFTNWIKPHSSIKKINSDLIMDDEATQIDNTHWLFALDSSLNEDEENWDEEYDDGETIHNTNNLEIISPVFPNIATMLKEMKSLFEFLQSIGGYGTNDTGLHINMSISEKQQNEMNKLKLVVLAADDNILQDFDRGYNEHTMSMKDNLVSAIAKSYIEPKKMSNFEDAETQILSNLIPRKNNSINFKGISYRTDTEIVEFRAPGNDTYLMMDYFHKIENAAKHYAICLKASYDDTYYQDDYIKLLNRLVQHTHTHGSSSKYDVKITQHDDDDDIDVDLRDYMSHPFIEVMRFVLFGSSYLRITELMLKDLYYIENGDVLEKKYARNSFLDTFVIMCVDARLKDISISVNQCRIIRKTMQEFNIKIDDIDLEELYFRSDIENYSRIKRLHLDNREIYRLVLGGFDLLLKKNRQQEVEEEREKYPLFLFSGGILCVHDSVIVPLTDHILDEVSAKILKFPTPYRNENSTMLIIPESHVMEIKNVFNLYSQETKLIRKLKQRFKEIYQRDISVVTEYNDSNGDQWYHFDDNDSRDEFLHKISYIFDIKIIGGPGETLLKPSDYDILEGSLYNHLFNLERLCD